MASITIRNLRDDTKKRLRLRAAEHGRSLEAEVRDILDRCAAAPKSTTPMTGLDVFQPLRALVEKYGGFELELPPRTRVRDSELWETHLPQGVHEEPQPFRPPAKTRRRRK
jgi:plasmid stability protein